MRDLIQKGFENSNYGKNPNERTLDELFLKGFVIVDKHKGCTSHQIAEYVKEILPVSKSGHSGTLDPQVTGVLLVGLGKTTRLMEYMLESNKEYICLCYFHKPVTQEQLELIFEEFRGEIEQMPPIVSSVKRQKRKRVIYELEQLDSDEYNQHVLFRVSCQHGTYIRKLCTDMGLFLGINAQMIELRRIKAGPVKEGNENIGLDKLRNLYQLYIESDSNDEKKRFLTHLKNYIRPMEELVKGFEYIVIKDSALESLSHGRDLAIPGILYYSNTLSKNTIVAIFTGKGELVAMGNSLMDAQEIYDNQTGFCVEVQKVFLEGM